MMLKLCWFELTNEQRENSNPRVTLQLKTHFDNENFNYAKEEKCFVCILQMLKCFSNVTVSTFIMQNIFGNNLAVTPF